MVEAEGSKGFGKCVKNVRCDKGMEINGKAMEAYVLNRLWVVVFWPTLSLH